MLRSPIISQKGVSIVRILALIPGAILIVFVGIGLLSNPFMKQVLYMDSVQRTLSGFQPETLVEIMGWENPYFNKVLPKTYKRVSFTSLTLKTITDINFEDERSLLGNELPGFALFDTNIVAAGEGTNYTNVPNDTPPSIGYVLKQQQQDLNSSQSNSDSNSGTPAPITSNVKNAEVLIYSTHTWENYLPLLGLTGDPNADQAVGTGAPNQGVHLVDTWLQEDLTQDGVPAEVNFQDAAKVLSENNWNTNQAYEASRPIVEDALKTGKPYKLIIDIHRDSARQNVTTVQINNQSFARVDIVIGKADPHYQDNEAIASKLNDAMNKYYPGLSRGIFEKSTSEGNGVYNQDLSKKAILLEIGGVDNNETQLKNTCQALAKLINIYING